KVGQPIILYMPMAQLADITAALARGGMASDTPAAIIQGASTAEERVVESSLATLADDARREGIGAPAIVVIGKIAGLRQGLLSSMVGWQ
ncbi:MAG: uroporphyrin-III methyltransferase, partial [Reyranella sp.]|nr:uroporphyrin-III methyltransferase [Reyranella sp.]